MKAYQLYADPGCSAQIFSSVEKVCEQLDIWIARGFITKWQKTQLLQNGFCGTAKNEVVATVKLDETTMDSLI